VAGRGREASRRRLPLASSRPWTPNHRWEERVAPLKPPPLPLPPLRLTPRPSPKISVKIDMRACVQLLAPLPSEFDRFAVDRPTPRPKPNAL